MSEQLNERNNPFKGDKKHLITDPVFLIGNGKSRNDFDLNRLKSIGTTIGCNAIYREKGFQPDIIVAIDSKMLTEMTKAKYSQQEHETAMIILPHNRAVPIPGSYVWKSQRFNTSGAFAMRMISNLLKPKKCYMLGMDGYPGNVYDGTKNYAVHTLKNFSGVHKFYMEILSQSKQTVFINVNHQDGWPPECVNTDKYSFMTYDLFEKIVL